MNGLSWLLYAAEALGGLRDTLTIGGVLLLIFGTMGGTMTYAIASDGWSWDTEETKERRKSTKAVALKGLRMLWIFVPIAIAIGIFIPSKNTIMLIAASEVGEEIVNSEQAKQIGGEAGEIAVDSLKLLRKYLDEQLGKDAPKV